MINRRLLQFAFVALGLVALPASAVGAEATAGTHAPFRDGTVLVGFRSGTTADQRAAVLRSAGVADERVIGAGTHVLRVPAGKVTAKIALLEANPRVRYAEPDYIVNADTGPTTGPNDQYYNKLWGMKTISADAAWASTTGSSSVVVGVVDTGVDYTHPDLAANIWSNPGSINGCLSGTHGYNVISATCNPMDDNHHGTHVSGTIGAVGNNGIGVIGVSPTVRIMGLKFLNSTGSGSTSGAVAAIDWAVRAKQAGVNIRVLSNSWGGGGFSQALLDEINKAGANDILFVAAAGNNGTSNDTTAVYPCSYHTANEICVAATDSHDSLASFSNYGANSVDLAAPGQGILSTVPGGYDTFSGTSMATPHVSGAAALALSTGYQSVWTLKATILAAVDPLASLAGRVSTGGRLDVCKAIPACSGVAPPPPPPPPPPTVGDFSISSVDARQAVGPGGSTSYTVAVTPTGGFSGQVALAIGGLPAGAVGTVTPTPVSVASAAGTTTLNVTAGPSTPHGNYTLTITGTCASLTHTTSVVLQVKNN
jgi:subtilisin family serine protease